MFCTTPDAAPAVNSLNRLHATGGRDVVLGQGSTLRDEPPLMSECPTHKRGFAPGKVKKCAGVIYSKGDQLNLVPRLASFPDSVLPQDCPDTHRRHP